MALDRTWYNTLVDDDGSNTIGTVWKKADVNSLMNAIDASLALLLPLAGGTLTGTLTLQNSAGASLNGVGASGVGIAATHASGAIRFYSGGVSEVARFENTGQFFLGETVGVLVNTRLGVAFSGAGSYGTGIEIVNTGNTNNASFEVFVANGVKAGEITRVGTTAAVVYTTTSDENLKDDFRNFDDALDRVRRIDAGTFTWKSDRQPGSGFKAQQLATIYPDAVVSLGVDKGALTPLLVGAIKELASQLDALKEGRI